MKRIKVGDWVLCPGSESPVQIDEKEQMYLSGIGKRTVYWVQLDRYRANYLREDLILNKPTAS
ncbi:MAG: hypothetical protein V3W37_08710 [Candidatus Binatia bacterium]